MSRLNPRCAFVLALFAAFCAASAALSAAYWRVGRTPGELMDYVERRLEGHPRIEMVALPLLKSLRHLLNAPSVAERARAPFNVPPRPHAAVPTKSSDSKLFLQVRVFGAWVQTDR